jgi:murein DD-endopeptidase MepM/ murein hydrolase activator NlpD
MFVKSRLSGFFSQRRCYLCLLVLLFSNCTYPSKSKKTSVNTSFRHREGVFHTVRRGQTLWRIAKTYEVKLEDIVNANKIADPSKIMVGQKIFIPYTKKVSALKPASSNKPKKVTNTKFIWPIKGDLISTYGYNSGVKNEGIDIAAPEGTDIRAAYSGRVIYSDDKMQYYGNMVILKHEQKCFTVYAHNLVNLVSAQQWVNQGQIIARVGKTGRANSSRLHFEIRHAEKTVNPLSYLP